MEAKFPQEYLFKPVSPATLARKRAAGICKHFGCTNPIRHKYATDCNTCSSRKQRLANPVNYAYHMLKKSAIKRNIEFKLTLEEFTAFDRETGYVERMGRSNESLTVDRIKSSKGYEVGNIRALSYEDNVSRRLEGMTQPCDPIAMVIYEHKGSPEGVNWRAFRAQAMEVYDLVTRLQGYEPNPPEQEDEDSNPF